MEPALNKLDHSEATNIVTRPAMGPNLVAYAFGLVERRALGVLIDMLEHCTPQPKVIVANTVLELIDSAKEADHVLLFQDSATSAVRRAVSQGIETSKALSEWQQHAEKTAALLEQLDDLPVLVLSGDDVTEKLAHHLGILFSGSRHSFGCKVSVSDDLILDCIVANAVLRAPELREMIGGFEAHSLETSLKMDSLNDLTDDAISKYFVVQSKIVELQEDQERLRSQLMQAQRSLQLHLDAFHYATNRADGDTSPIHGAFYEVLSQGGDQRRREPLRAALSHTQTVADIGPLTPRAISAPFLTKRLPLSMSETASGVPGDGSPYSTDDFPVGSEVALPSLLRRNATVKLQGDKLEIRRGAPGHQFYGPYLKPPQGRYGLDATFKFLLSDRLTRLTPRDGPVLEVICGDDQPLATRHFSATVFSAGCQNVSLEFDLPSYRDKGSIPGLEVRLWTNGNVGLIVDDMKLRRLA